MCGFLYSTYNLTDEEVEKTEFTVKNRGPDAKNVLSDSKGTFVHYLLHITGEKTTQPIRSSNDDVRLLYNGEVYNYSELGNYKSDGPAILDAYVSEGINGIRKLDGEFSGVIRDETSNKLVLFRDTFGTKPMFFGSTSRGLFVCSYQSQAIELGANQIFMPEPNTILEICLKSMAIVKHSYREFDLEQKKNTYDDWYEAFFNSIRKRTNNNRVKYFIGLSSGYDSGLISAVMTEIGVDFKSYSIQAAEDIDVIKQRAQILKHNEYFHLTEMEFEKQKTFLQKNCEPFTTPPRHNRPNGYSVLRDKGAVGTGIICEKARNDDCKVYMSGQGSDEILSDYGHNGQLAPGFLHGTIAGKFPEDLSTVFPWENFYQGTQLEFIAKDENVGGTYGIETRYPFLDPALVQEFLWMNHHLKNAKYKAPIDYALRKMNFPMSKQGLFGKVGFRANSNYRK